MGERKSGPRREAGRAAKRPADPKRTGETNGDVRYAPECYACPMGALSMAMQSIPPETAEHLFRAGRELVLAARSLLDGLTEAFSAMEERSQQASVESIPIRKV